MSLMGMWRAVVDAFSGSCRRCPRCCWRRELDRASFGLALPVGMRWRWPVRVQRVVMPVTGAESWTVVDGGWAPVEPVERYLGYLAGIERSPNTLRAYAHGLRLWFEFLGARRLVWDSVGIEDTSKPTTTTSEKTLPSTSAISANTASPAPSTTCLPRETQAPNHNSAKPSR